MMNSTESVIRLRATWVDSSPSNMTCPQTISNATVGSGIGSVMNNIVATTDIVSMIMPSRVRPSGSGRLSRMAPTRSAPKNQRFSQK
jgi:hypothetical protein